MIQIQASDIRIGDRIIAYCNNKQQSCTVKRVEDAGFGCVSLTVCPSDYYRNSLSRVVQFRQDALVNLAG
jgi:hypothetical protein